MACTSSLLTGKFRSYDLGLVVARRFCLNCTVTSGTRKIHDAARQRGDLSRTYAGRSEVADILKTMEID